MAILTHDQIRSLAPAVFAGHHRMTDRYRQINTAQMIEQLSNDGWVPVGANQDNPRLRDPRMVTHLVTLRHIDTINNGFAGDQVPQILIINSHNGRTKLRLRAGFYRFACANGLVVGRDMMTFEARHSGDVLSDASLWVHQTASRLSEINSVFEAWARKTLSPAAMERFAKEAAKLRFGGRSGCYEPGVLLEARRAEDEGNNLYRVFNRVQENLTRHSLDGVSANGRQIRSRPLTSVQGSIDFNDQLWRLAEAFA